MPPLQPPSPSPSRSLDPTDLDFRDEHAGSGSGSGSGSDDYYFEGVEKRVEIWFSCTDGGRGDLQADLRRIPRTDIEDMLELVQCKVISFRSSPLLDEYVLSESSLFVYKKKLMLKTCGTTTPIACLEQLLKLAKEYAGFDKMENIYYSRKNFGRPEQQEEPHRNFQDETKFLDKYFPYGKARCYGTMNEDCWYLYTQCLPENQKTIKTEPRQMIEILMNDLDPEVMKKFTKEGAKNGAEATKLSGIDKLLPSMEIDDFLFDPCGYSMNGVLKNGLDDAGEGQCMTIHITPESEFSYVSFECNVPASCYVDLVERVVETFRPGKFVLAIMSDRDSPSPNLHSNIQPEKKIGSWTARDHNYSVYPNYEVTYAFFVRPPS